MELRKQLWERRMSTYGNDKKLIDHLPSDYKKPEDIIGENELLKEF